jgi:hypothetical protein
MTTTPVNREDIDRELLTVTEQKLKAGETAYAQLFEVLTVEDRETLKVKEQQTVIAQHLINDLSPLEKMVLKMQLGTRDLEHAFEELYNILISIKAGSSDE